MPADFDYAPDPVDDYDAFYESDMETAIEFNLLNNQESEWDQ